MKKIIHDIDPSYSVFYLIFDGRKIGFYLTNKLSKTFYSYLDKGVMVDFEITPKMKTIRKRKFFQVAYFNQIISLNPYRVHYDLFKLRDDMRKVLKTHQYYLFIDFEMTMPGYRDDVFKPEIIQAGYVLSEPNKDIIRENDLYILPKERRTLSRRTKRFLNLEEADFFQKAEPFQVFYDDLKVIIDTYHPKLVVWGKNDLTALRDAYIFHDLPHLTDDHDFIDLLKLHKDYFNLKDDLGLFKAYKTYYQVDYDQAHDAKDDALVTKYVFDAFLSYI